MTAKKKADSGELTPFTFIGAINKKRMDYSDEDIDKKYNIFLANKSFSFFIDTIFFSNEMNMYAFDEACVSKKMNHDFYYHGVTKNTQRFSRQKWKANPIDNLSKNDQKVFSYLKEKYKYNDKRLLEVFDIIPESEKENIISQNLKGGKTK